jgi:flagellar basal-body rod protein FlgC
MVVTIAPDVPAGLYDVVAVGRYGASNTRTFLVGTSAEITKAGEPDSPSKAQEVAADATITARPTAGKSDHYAVPLKAGQRIRAEVWARRIDSRMTPVLDVLDGAGRVLATARRRHADDPFLDFTAPADGRYVLRIHDLYAAGGDDNHYRLSVSTAPQIDFVFPPVARIGESVKVDVYGTGLPGATPAALPALSAQEGTAGLEKITIDVRAGDPARGATVRSAWRLLAPRDATADLVDLFGDVPGAAQPLAPALLAPTAPITEVEPNDLPAAAQSITFPVTLAGRFYPRGDRDWFTFEAKAGDTFLLDLVSNRLGLQTDPCLTIESVTAGPDGKPYKARQVVFQTELMGAAGALGAQASAGVRVTNVVESDTPGRRVHDPKHPAADEQGYVTFSNVSAVEEMVNMISASRSYQNNVEVMNTAKQLLLKTLQMGQ